MSIGPISIPALLFQTPWLDPTENLEGTGERVSARENSEISGKISTEGKQRVAKIQFPVIKPNDMCQGVRYDTS